MKEIVSRKNLIAYCGLYCGSCRKYLLEKCPGCHENEKAGWCKIRTCCKENRIISCADCQEFNDVNDCRKFNNLLARIFGLIFRSDRRSCIQFIKDNGYEAFSKEMSTRKMMTFRK